MIIISHNDRGIFNNNNNNNNKNKKIHKKLVKKRNNRSDLCAYVFERSL